MVIPVNDKMIHNCGNSQNFELYNAWGKEGNVLKLQSPKKRQLGLKPLGSKKQGN